MTSSTRIATLQRLTATFTLIGASACGGSAFSSNDAGHGGTGPTTSDGSGGTSTGGSGGTSSGGSGGTSIGGSGGTSTSGTSAGNTTGSSTTSSGGATTTGSTTAAGGSGGSGGGSGEVCRQPIAPGNCNAYFPAYGFNVDSGFCESFVYGGCGGNDNRFDALQECLDTCDPGGLTACNTHTDCVIDGGCCGICEEPSLEKLKVVNRAYDSSRSPECQLVDCAFCDPPGLEQFGTRCNMGQCEVYDVRESDLSVCENDDDCRLRNGIGCCESCSADDWVAISIDPMKLSELVCGDEPLACPPCVAIVPEGLAAACGDNGHCAVVSTP
jgi:hypothetical protein